MTTNVIEEAGTTSSTSSTSTCSECDMWSGRHLRDCSALAARSPEAQKVVQAATRNGISVKDAEDLFRAGWKCGQKAASEAAASSVQSAAAAQGTRFYRR